MRFNTIFPPIGRRIVSLNARQIKCLTGNVQTILVAFKDITERKKVEEAIGISELRYRRLFESAEDGILIIDANTGMIKDVNPFMLSCWDIT